MKAVCKKLSINGFKLSPIAIAMILSACGGTGQDEGTASISSQTYSGLAIDGHLARSTVYLDTNNNGTRDSWEAFAFTDNEGYYSYNPNTETNYCAADATAEQQQYCLRGSSRRANVVVRIDGGYDILTGEPFMGQMSRRLTDIDTSQENVDTKVVSPITSLLTDVDSNQHDNVLSNLGLNSNDVDVDYLNDSGQGMTNNRILNAALKVHKTVAVLSDRITDTYQEIGDEMGTPNDASPSVYRSLGEVLSNSNNDLDSVLNSNEQLNNVVRNSEERIRSVYERRDINLPNRISDTTVSRVSEVARGVGNTINRLIDRNQEINADNNGVRGASRAIEALVIKANEENDQNDSSIENTVNFFLGENTSDLVDSLLNALASDTADVSSLATNDFNGDDFDSAEEIINAASVGEDAERFASVAGKQLRVSDLDLGYAPNNLKDMEIEVYFAGSEGDISGTFVACAKYIEDAHVDGTLGEANTHGELVHGYWSMLGTVGDQQGSYSLLLTIEFLGATYQAIMKSVGNVTLDNVQYRQIRFDNDGDYRIWHSAQGLVDNASMPTSNRDCEERLPSRVGL